MDDHGQQPFWRSPIGLAVIGFLLIAGFFLARRAPGVPAGRRLRAPDRAGGRRTRPADREHRSQEMTGSAKT